MTLRVHHLNCGSMCPQGGRLLFYRKTRDRALHRLTCQCLLVETPAQGLVLIDTGFGQQDVATPPQRIAPFFRRLNGITVHAADTAAARWKRWDSGRKTSATSC